MVQFCRYFLLDGINWFYSLEEAEKEGASRMKKNVISIVSPVYRAEKIVGELVAEVKQAVSLITEDFEIILVNDSSPDGSWKKIVEEAAKDKRVKGINLSRNFGQHYAITAGL